MAFIPTRHFLQSGKRWLPVGITALWMLLVAFPSAAQYTKLLDFGNTPNGTDPYGAVISDGTFLYGMTSNGGPNDAGTIYKVKTNGTGFTTLLDFDGTTNGSNPLGSLLSDGTFLYGMTYRGGANGQGTIFKIKPDGTAYATLFDFDYSTTGGFPYGSLIYDGTFLYGMTSTGGSKFYGTIFKIKPDGTGFTLLVEFDNVSKGATPYGSLLSDGTFLYAMTNQGGVSSFGAIVKVKTDGTGFVKLLDFTGSANGSNPFGSLITDGTFLYGMTMRGGASNYGTIFKIKPDGSTFSKLFDFSNSANGASPRGSLVSDGTFLYGMNTDFGSGSRGIIFKIMPDGSGYSKLVDNDVGANGPYPEGTLLMSGTTMYGVRSGHGAGMAPFYPGTVFTINTNGSGYTKLFTFEGGGTNPVGSLVSDGTFLYGGTTGGGLLDYGTLFKVKTDGTGYVKLLDFVGTNGRGPCGRLISDGTFLYGMTTSGGAKDEGTIFKIKFDGTGYVKLLDFDDALNGAYPNGSLITDGTFLYGMTEHGGPGFYGSIFKIMPDGSNFNNLYNFDYTNDGGYPNGSLIGVAGILYGMTYQGGANSQGTIFKIQPNGTGFTKLLDFDGTNGANPRSSLTYDGISSLIGMATEGGANSDGTIFKIKTDGTGFTTLFNFDDENTGSFPYGSFTSSGGFMYGMTSGGGQLGNGTLFRIKPDGTSYAKMVDFNDGAYAQGSLISDGTFVYGMTNSGGINNKGILFKSTLTLYPTITSFFPAAGVEGTYVTLQGTNFDPVPSNNIVTFNNLTAVVVSGTTTSLTAIVPVGATSGPIAVTSGLVATSVDDFDVTTEALIFNGIVQNCDVEFTGPDNIGYDDDVITFKPVSPSDKVSVSFSSFHVEDELLVYDGPSITSPLIATLNGSSLPADIVATGPGGELTFVFVWEDGTSGWDAYISCQSSGTINISKQPTDVTACDGDVAVFSTAASGTTNITYQWQYSPDGIDPFTDITNGAGYSNATTATLSVNTTGNFGEGRYRCRMNGDAAAEVMTNDEGLFINARPSPPVSSGLVQACGPVSVTLSVTGGTDGQYAWYTVSNGGTPISGQVNGGLTTPILGTATTYYVAIDDGTCESTRTAVVADVQVCNPPTIASTLATAFVEGIVSIDLTNLIHDTDNNIDLSSLKIISQPASGAPATLSGLTLAIDYSGIPFASTDVVGLEVCDLTALCTTQQILVELAGDITVFNAVSPNGDGKNEFLFLQYIEVLPATQQNQVKIYNRWGDEVFSISDYNNHDRVFAGNGSGGNKLPGGTYYYKISFNNGGGTRTGYLELKY